ncbi:MAG: mismatch-specific DNA-glycosylase [Acidimicrobiia bacterium]
MRGAGAPFELGDPTGAPLRLARLHAASPVGRTVVVDGGDLPRPEVEELLVGGGFEPDGRRGALRATRARTLPDLVAPGLRLLVCGLNPSLHAADAAVPYAGPGNRFWPAARAVGLVGADRDPWRAVLEDGIGFTDLVKRATPAAAALTAAEHRAGLARVERLCARHAPAALALVGLAGWRRAADPGALPGWQDRRLGGVPVYLLPSTSGRNAATGLPALTAHLAAALAGPSRRAASGRRR